MTSCMQVGYEKVNIKMTHENVMSENGTAPAVPLGVCRGINLAVLAIDKIRECLRVPGAASLCHGHHTHPVPLSVEKQQWYHSQSL